MIPQFTMSQYATKESLLEAKCAWLEGQIEWLEDNYTHLHQSIVGAKTMEFILPSGKSEYVCGESLLDCIDQAQEKEKA